MASSVNSPEDVINIALARVGYKGRISNVFDGSPAAKKALDIYAQTRDAVLRIRPWSFAEQVTPSTPTANPPPGVWTNEFIYPPDCIMLRQVLPPGYAADVNNPLPVLYRIGRDGNQKVIWTRNAANVILIYTARVTDPSQWEDPTFVETLVSMLAKQLAPVLGDMKAADFAAKDAQAALDARDGDPE